ncbi:uncharacterized protein si:ch73-52p7.1 isoform X2 [Corythoichthys intestinalis]|nr:uncharacterized protein si:ch73-52p7.1 isoform X2 [Corythoichthys intestinalis]XP_057704893.1 uncharacterized protein si:ch73-52p7.1 isoform X2 [Corythoichthys intestinalis]
MASLGPPAPLLCVLLWVSVAPQRSDMRLAYVTQDSFYYYACSKEPEACSMASLATCRCKAIPTPYSSPVFRMRRLTVWYTSPWNAARLLNNSEVLHLTLMDCRGGSRESAVPSSEGHFAVQHLEQLSVINFPLMPQTNMEPESDNDLHFEADRWRWREAPQEQHVVLGRERGAAYHEQARLGVIHGSVLRGGAAGVKVYTVQTHIDSDGTLPFPDLCLPKLPETSVIYVSFVYKREPSED